MKQIISTQIFIQHEDESRKDFEKRINDFIISKCVGIPSENIDISSQSKESYCAYSLVIVKDVEKTTKVNIGF